ncbi:MAG: HD domain-containing protein [Rickettsia sp.]|jgi:(p)ppGpp synthase/HD superfamily hydrolase|nr:HD domain-containing protein [Rickettsia sp.]
MNEEVNRPIDIDEVIKAIYYAKKYHGSQMRQSGEPYYSHPIEVAYMISDYLFRTDIIVTSILHDTIEDTTLTEKMIAYIFGEQVASQVEDLSRNKPHGKISSAEIMEEFIIVAMHLKIPAIPQNLVALCYQNLSIPQCVQHNLYQTFVDNSQLLSPIFQNDINQL